ncbi:major facilitator superfamily domain-containing protein [Radiomyces spectabilis]|uniref:major facilitator superfamily domain-containing protein n=1 Tax=Radiomyces spectabilis TaxID=64574 RepID=UPI00221E982E|nr:major facilitator superfamily domain-containing protein [Radiomyces spectabilis]KAI8372860.1 major facilitator superfamily domain-containing protein [Radiomyces spectabilis]
MDSLDQKTPSYMVYCVIVACLQSFANGYVIGSPNVPGEATHNCPTGNAHIFNKSFPDCLPMSPSLWGFAVSSFCVGGLVGSMVGGPMQVKLGRKKSIILNTVGFIVGGALISVSVNTAMFIVGRLLSGVSCGLGSLVVPTYIGEVSTVRSRGMMGTCNQFGIVIGILLASVIGLPLATVPLWRVNYAIAAVPGIAQFFLMSTCVDSPRWLVSKNRIDEARHALQRLRGNANIDREFYEIVEGQVGTAAATSMLKNPDSERTGDLKEKSKDAAELSGDEDDEDGHRAEDAMVAPDVSARESMSIKEIFTDSVMQRIAMTVICLHMIQQLIGINAVMYYSATIFASMFDARMSQYMAIVTTIVNFLMTIVSLFAMDRMGRRPLLMIAEVGACIFSVLLIIGYRFNIGALLVVSVFGYVASFAIGVGPIPWLITSEIAPVYASSAIGAIATTMNWTMNFVIGQIFPIIFAKIKGYSFAIFATVAAFAFVFTYFCLPETKNRSIENIVRGYEKFRK